LDSLFSVRELTVSGKKHQGKSLLFNTPAKIEFANWHRNEILHKKGRKNCKFTQQQSTRTPINGFSCLGWF